VLNTITPLSPEDPTSAVCTVSDPDPDLVLSPLLMLIDPPTPLPVVLPLLSDTAPPLPVAAVVLPPNSDSDPPLPESPLPTTMLTDPP